MSLAWVDRILKEVKPGEDGTVDWKAVSASIEAELPKHTVPKADYEKAAAERDTAQTQLNNLKGADIIQLQQELETERSGRKKDRQDAAIRTELTALGAMDVDYLLYKLGDTAELFNDDGSLKDKAALAESLKQDYPAQFQQKPPPAGPGGFPPPPAGIKDVPPPKATNLNEAIRMAIEAQNTQK